MSVITPFDESIYLAAPPVIRRLMNEERRSAGLPPFVAPDEETRSCGVTVARLPVEEMAGVQLPVGSLNGLEAHGC